MDQTTKRLEAETPAEPKAPEEPASLLNEKDKDEAKGPPSEYKFSFPEGATVDPKAVEEATAIFKDLGLNNKGAQRLMDLYSAKMKDLADAPMKQWTEQQKEWQSQIKNDKDIGGKLSEVRSTVAKAIDTIADPKLALEFRQAMDATGAGNHPAFIKTFYKLAQSIVEGGHVSGSQPSKFGQQAPGAAERPSAAKALYPNNP